MPASVQSPADVLNLALVRIGYKNRVANLYDGSEAAQTALDIYAQTRDELLRQDDWDFAERIAAAAVLASPAVPAIWTAQYTYPEDCIRVRDLYGAAYLADSNNPIPTRWTIGDVATGKVIWANITGATLVYTSRVTDPAQWDADFVEAMASSAAAA